MSDPQAADAMNAVAAATKGPDTPEAATVVARPAPWAVSRNRLTCSSVTWWPSGTVMA